MKRISKKALFMMVGFSSIVLIALIMLYVKRVISGTALDILALISFIPFLLLFIPHEKEEIWKGTVVPNWLPRTKESTAFEAAAAFILIIAWIIALTSRNGELHVLALITLAVIVTLTLAYSTMGWVYGRGRVDSMKQCLINARLNRIVAVETSLFAMLSVIPGVDKAVIIAFIVVAVLAYICASVINK
ncbi:MAG: hypothetical protein IJK93_01405 [Muribaculaceae bacterium]|nr:hypothetical protein [Muribaculaceae bacterium]